jgi:hypothetical protein
MHAPAPLARARRAPARWSCRSPEPPLASSAELPGCRRAAAPRAGLSLAQGRRSIARVANTPAPGARVVELPPGRAGLTGRTPDRVDPKPVCPPRSATLSRSCARHDPIVARSVPLDPVGCANAVTRDRGPRERPRAIFSSSERQAAGRAPKPPLAPQAAARAPGRRLPRRSPATRTFTRASPASTEQGGG